MNKESIIALIDNANNISDLNKIIDENKFFFDSELTKIANEKFKYLKNKKLDSLCSFDKKNGFEINKLFSDKCINLEYLENLAKNGAKNGNTEIKNINKLLFIFLDKKVSNHNKITILRELFEYQEKWFKVILYFNNELNKEFIIDCNNKMVSNKKTIEFKNLKFIRCENNLLKLEKSIFDISKKIKSDNKNNAINELVNEVCQHALIMILEYFFPQITEDELSTWTDEIIKYLSNKKISTEHKIILDKIIRDEIYKN